ncbi:hypothetical protein OH77DRAFT_211779 [Trametes cingulata]|nr:hypothetical protein OH77DRAFT_211779 [Trametes cingulata]
MRTPKVDLRQREQVRMAKKKAEMKAAVTRSPQHEWSFVYVGNLSSKITEEELKTLFQRCGTVRRIELRASAGVCVPTAGLPKSFWGFGEVEDGVHYASVEYTKPASARQALQLSGTELYGRHIVVSFSVADLPEISDVILSHLRKKKAEDEAQSQKDALSKMRAVWQAKFGQLK